MAGAAGSAFWRQAGPTSRRLYPLGMAQQPAAQQFAVQHCQ